MFLKELDTILTKFLWGGKTSKIKKSTTYKPYSNGGLNMYNVYSSLAAFKISWLKRIGNYDQDECCSLRIYPCLQNLRKLGNVYPEHIRKNLQNPFWQDVLKHLNKFMQTPIKLSADDKKFYLNEPLLFNSNLKTGKNVITNKEWIENKILTIKDIMNDDLLTFMDFRTFKTKYEHTPNTHFLVFNSIVYTARQYLTKLKKNTDKCVKCSYWVWEAIKTGNHKVREYLEKDDKPPSSTLKSNSYFPNLIWKTIFLKCFKITIDTQLQWFQARILHRILPTRKYLKMCKIINSSHCLFCINHQETFSHLFWECHFVQKFWKDLETMLKTKCYNCARFSFKMDLVIFGISNGIRTDNAIDFIILFAKFYIYKCRFLDITPNHTSFIVQLKHGLSIERLLALKRNNFNQFQILWLPYLNIFENTN